MKTMQGSVCNRLEEGMQKGELCVGMGATEMLYSDRKPYTVQRIISDKRVIVTADAYKRVDGNGVSECQEYEYESTPLVVEEPKVMCRHPFAYLLEQQGAECKHRVSAKSCEGCKHYKRHRKTNGIVLIKCKHGWKQMGSDTYFALGIRECYYDYSF